VEPQAEVFVDYGYDTTRYGPGGAIGGSSFLFELGGGTLPKRGSDGLFAYFQTDAIHTIHLIGRSKISGRAALGLAEGSRFGRHFFLSSFDNLRGYRFNDSRLLGDGYYVTQAELAFPLDFLIRFAFFSGITGIVGVDFGGVVESSRAQRHYPTKPKLFATFSEAWRNRSMDYVLGVNLGLGPFELRVQFAHGVDIGGIIPETNENGDATWVPNISLHYAYF
jgi:outer membrane protein assembly factor BamA